jgi:hypothetical protein
MKILLLLVVLVLAPACGDQVQKAKPPEKPAATAMPAGHPAIPPDHPTIGHGTATRPTADPFAEGGTTKPAMGAASVDPEKLVMAGEISLDPGVTVGQQYTIYVATIFDPKERAPVYIKKYESPKFPFKFEIKEKDAGMGASQSDRPLYVRAMISDTGDAMKNRNRTTSEKAHPRGTSDVKLTIKP